MTIDIWGFESQIYPGLDATKMNGECNYNEKFELGDGQWVAVEIFNNSRKVLDPHQIVKVSEITFRVNFWRGGDTKSWLRIDTDNVGFLHFHLKTGRHSVEEHQELEGEYNINELVSHSFEECQKFLNSKFPESQINDSDSFTGFM
jgi:hypothetical protein